MNALKLLFNPIFLLAAGLHAGLLMIPVAGGSSDEIVPAPNPEGESITVTRIPPKTVQPGEQAAVPQSRSAVPPTTTGVTAVRQPVTRSQPAGAAQQQTQRPTQTSQSSDKGPTSSTNNRRQADSSNTERQTNRSTSHSTNEIAVLPSDESNTATNNAGSRPSATQTEQAAPTLVALKDGAQVQEVPKLLRDFLARLRHSVLRTTEPEVEEAKQAWLTTLREQPAVQISEPQALEKSLEISYPIITDNEGPRRYLSCLTPLPEKGLAGVVVNPDGAIATEPTLLRSSGYEFINDIALAKLQDYADFPEADSQKLYTVDIEVNYDPEACIELRDLKK